MKKSPYSSTTEPIVDAPSCTTRMDHVALVVESLDRSQAFYSELLAIEPINRVDMGDHRIQYLGSGTAVRLELIEFMPSLEADATADGRRIGMRHIAWEVSELAQVVARVESLGGSILTEATWVPRLGFHSALIRDTDGIEVELIHRL